MRRWRVTVLALAGLGIAGCSGSSTGSGSARTASPAAASPTASAEPLFSTGMQMCLSLATVLAKAPPAVASGDSEALRLATDELVALKAPGFYESGVLLTSLIDLHGAATDLANRPAERQSIATALDGTLAQRISECQTALAKDEARATPSP